MVLFHSLLREEPERNQVEERMKCVASPNDLQHLPAAVYRRMLCSLLLRAVVMCPAELGTA